MAVAADHTLDLIRRDTGLVHRLLTGQDGVSTQRLVHRDFVPATVDRRMSEPDHRDLAAVLPDAEPVLVSPPLIPVWSAHGPPFLYELMKESNVLWFGAVKDSLAPLAGRGSG